MPYRRLPNTDPARLKAFQIAIKIGEFENPINLAFSQKNLLNMKNFYPHYEQLIVQYKQNRHRQSQIGKQLVESFKSARLYVSHFFQVINLSIIRGELKPEVRSFYKIDNKDKSVPDITSEQQLIYWGELLIKGEEVRTATGASRIYNPSPAMVKVKYEQFVEQHNLHKDLLLTVQKQQQKVISYRQQADDLILDVWNEVEATFNDLPPDKKRKKCAEYGITYVFRPNEKSEEN